MLNQQNLKKFLREAKINTYAKGGEGGEKILKDGGKRFEYKRGDLYYRDVYFGFNPFIGQEVIFYQKKSIWAMNYYGEIITESASAKEIYSFLKKALKKVIIDKPFRGPSSFNIDNFQYRNKSKGTLDYFIGEEKIYYKKELIYTLNYHGGFIQNYTD